MPTRLTDAQQRRIDELATSCAERPSAASGSGATIVRQFTRYLERSDASEIKRALYEFLMGTCDFIAHNGLIPPDGGFRYAYAEPIVLIEELYRNDRSYLERWHGPAQPRCVYSDGQTDREVYAQVLALARHHEAVVLQGARERTREGDIALARALAESNGLLLVPNHDKPQRAAGATNALQLFS